VNREKQNDGKPGRRRGAKQKRRIDSEQSSTENEGEGGREEMEKGSAFPQSKHCLKYIFRCIYWLNE